MLKDSHKAMIEKIDVALDSGAIDIDGWDQDHTPMILPKCITAAILKNEAIQYEGYGTSYEKQVDKEIRNIMFFL